MIFSYTLIGGRGGGRGGGGGGGVLKNLRPIAMYLKNNQPVMRPSLGLRGGFFIMSRSGGLKPRAVAGKPSVTKLTHNNCTGIKASGIPRAAVRKIL